MIKWFSVCALLLLLGVRGSENSYLDEVMNLPTNYLDGGCRNPGHNTVPPEIEAEKRRFTSRYSWAIPTQDAIDAIVKFSGGSIVDFGAGSGYWAHLLSLAGVDVIAIDDWSWGKPDSLWFPVKDGNESSLVGTSTRALLMVWPPQTDMALNALHTWDGNKLVFVGELWRGNASVEFFNEISHWHLIKKIVIPNWWNRNDAVYLLERADDGRWITPPGAGCSGVN